MNTQPRNKVLIIIIAILFIANIVTLSLFLLNKNKQGKMMRPDKNAMISAYLEKEIGFSKEQLEKYKTVSMRHRQEAKQGFDEMGKKRDGIFKELALADYTDNAIAAAADSMAAQQKTFATMTLRHMKEIRSLCNNNQQAAFDTGFYKIISKRGDGRKKK